MEPEPINNTFPNDNFIKQYNDELTKAIIEINEGKYYTQPEVELLLIVWEKNS
jgi:hypothetical protein